MTSRIPNLDVRQRAALLPFALVALSIVPVVAGALRIDLIIQGEAPRPEDVRFLSAPMPIITHIVAASVFGLIGAFQFSRALRRKDHWHRVVGRALIPCGMVVALSGLWMTLNYPRLPLDGSAVFWLRLAFGSAMVAAITLSMHAISRHDFRSHGAWMIRAYAIGMGAGTQVFTHLPWLLFVGQLDQVSRAILMGGGWVINVIVAEWAIHRRSRSTSPSLSVSKENTPCRI